MDKAWLAGHCYDSIRVGDSGRHRSAQGTHLGACAVPGSLGSGLMLCGRHRPARGTHLGACAVPGNLVWGLMLLQGDVFDG